jgi:hypothetical protein
MIISRATISDDNFSFKLTCKNSIKADRRFWVDVMDAVLSKMKWGRRGELTKIGTQKQGLYNMDCRISVNALFAIRIGNTRNRKNGKDIDHFVYPLLNAMSGVFYKDDSQVFVVNCEKKLIGRRDKPWAEITVVYHSE